MSMTVSWIVLTFNRAEKVRRAMLHNKEQAGACWDELVWVDNGSRDHVRTVMETSQPDVSVLLKENLGVAKGYNRAMALATKDLIVITGCDMLMPKNWLATFLNYMEKIPSTGVACMYSKPLDRVKERLRSPRDERLGGLPFRRAMPIERRCFRRSLLKDFGYLNEGFGFYGHEDCAWAQTVEKICDQKGLLYYVIPNEIAEHLGNEGCDEFNGKDDLPYHNFKYRESHDPSKQKLLTELRLQGWPAFYPY